ILSACVGAQFGEFFSNHSRATASKLFSKRATLSALLAFLSSLGSTPFAISSRAASRRFRALASVISGYFPNARRFSLPSKRYLKRQSFPPVGEISRY